MAIMRIPSYTNSQLYIYSETHASEINHKLC